MPDFSLDVHIGADLTEFKRELNNLDRQVRPIAQRMQSVGRSLTRAITAPLTAAGAAALAASAKFERLENGLATVMGSADEARKEIERLREVAQAPGIGFEQAIRGSQRLQAVGVEAGQARDILSEFSNALAAAGGTASDLDGVTLALTQIINKGKLSQEEINQLAERIPQVGTAMEKAFGGRTAEHLRDLGVNAQEFIAGVTEELSNLERVESGLSNAFSNAKIALVDAARSIGDAINEHFDITGIITKLTNALGEAVQWFQNLSAPVQKAVLAISGAAAAIGPLLIALGSVVSLLPIVAAGFSTLAGPIGIAVAAISGVAAAFTTLLTEGDGLANWLGSELPNVLNTAKAAWDTFKQVVSNVATAVFEAGDKIVSALGETVTQVSGQWVKGMSDSIGDILGLWETFGSNIQTFIGNAFDSIITIIATGIQAIGDLVSTGMAIVQGDWGAAWEHVKDFVVTIWEGIRTVILNAVDSILAGLEQFTSFMPGFQDQISGVRDSISNMLEADQITSDASQISDSVERVGDDTESSSGRMENALSKVVDNFGNVSEGSGEMEKNVEEDTNEIESHVLDLAGATEKLISSTEGSRDAMIDAWEQVKDTTEINVEKVKSKTLEIPDSFNQAAQEIQVDPFVDAFDSVVNGLESMSDAFARNVTASTGWLLDNLGNAIEEVFGDRGVWANGVASVIQSAGQIVDAFQRVGQSAKEVGQAIGSGFGAAVGALVGGKGGAQVGGSLGGLLGKLVGALFSSEDHMKGLGKQLNLTEQEVDSFITSIIELRSEIESLGGGIWENLQQETAAVFEDVAEHIKKGSREWEAFQTLITETNLGRADEKLQEFWKAAQEGGQEAIEFLREIWEDGWTQMLTNLRNDMDSGLKEAFSDGMKSAMQGEAGWRQDVMEGVKGAILDAVIQAFIQSSVIQEAIQPFINDFTEALMAGNTAAAQDMADKFFSDTLPEILDGIGIIADNWRQVAEDWGTQMEEETKAFEGSAEESIDNVRARLGVLGKEVGSQLKDNLLTSITGAFEEGFKASINGETYDWTTNMRDAIMTATRDALIDAFIQKAIIEKAVQPFIDEYVRLWQAGNQQAAMDLLDIFVEETVPGLVNAGEKFFGGFTEKWQQWASEGKAAGEEVGESFGSTFDKSLGESEEKFKVFSNNIADNLHSTLTSGLTSAFKEGFQKSIKGEEYDWSGNLRETVLSATRDALIDAFIQKAVIQQGIEPFVNEYVRLMQSGNTAAAMDLLDTFTNETVPGLLDASEGFFKPFIENWDSWSKAGKTAAEEVGGKTRDEFEKSQKTINETVGKGSMGQTFQPNNDTPNGGKSGGGGGLVGVFGEIADSAQQAAKAIEDNLTRGFQKMEDVLMAGMEQLAERITQTLSDALNTIMQLITVFVQHSRTSSEETANAFERMAQHIRVLLQGAMDTGAQLLDGFGSHADTVTAHVGAAFEQTSSRVEQHLQQTFSAADQLLEGFRSHTDQSVTHVSQTFDSGGSEIQSAMQATFENVEQGMDTLQSHIGSSMSEIESITASTSSEMESSFGSAASAVEGHFGSIKSTASSSASSIRSDMSSTASSVSSTFSGMASGVRSELRSLRSSASSTVSRVKSQVGSARSSIRDLRKMSVPSFDSGVTNFEGGLAMVHKDELLVNLAPGTDVIPADRNPVPSGGMRRQRNVRQTITVVLDGREIARTSAKNLPKELNVHGLTR